MSPHDAGALTFAPGLAAVDLFSGTPAEHFAVGQAGLAVPAPPAVAGASPQQVAGALSAVRDELVGSFLDNRLLLGHDAGPVLARLAPDARDPVRAAIGSGGEGTVFVRFVPGAELAAPPRLDGGLVVSRTVWQGVDALDVVSNYVVAYAFRRAERLVLVRSQAHWIFPFPGAVQASSAGMFLGDTDGFWQGMDCAASAHGLTGPAPAVDPQAQPIVVDTRAPDSYYDPAAPIDVPDGCEPTPGPAAAPPTR